MIDCEKCKEMSTSCFYRCDQTLTPTHEWYKPTMEELKKLYKGNVLTGMVEHVEMGGLDLRKL